MPVQVAETVLAFYDSLFDHLFPSRFSQLIDNPIKRRDVRRRVEEACDAASQSLTRLLVNEGVTEVALHSIVSGLNALIEVLTPEDVATTTYSPDTLLERFVQTAPPPKALATEAERTLYRVALHTVLQTLILV